MHRFNRISIAGFGLCLAASCSPAETEREGNAAPTANAAVPAAAANAASPARTAPDDLAGARALIERIYGAYQGDGPDVEAVMTPELRAAIARQSGTDGGGLGHDPFCACQDFGNFTYSIQSLEPAEGGAVARVAISNFGEPGIVSLRLARRGSEWLVADVGEGEESLLRGR